MAVKVSKRVYEGIMEIRDSGETNMFAYNKVMQIANEREMYAVVSWMHENKTKYAEGIIEGFEVEEN